MIFMNLNFLNFLDYLYLMNFIFNCCNKERLDVCILIYFIEVLLSFLLNFLGSFVYVRDCQLMMTISHRLLI